MVTFDMKTPGARYVIKRKNKQKTKNTVKVNNFKRGRYSAMCPRYLRNYNVRDCNSHCTFAHSIGELKIRKCTLNNCRKTIHCHYIHKGESINEFYKRLQYIPPNTNNPESCKDEQRYYDLKNRMDMMEDTLQVLIKNIDSTERPALIEVDYNECIKEIDDLLIINNIKF